MIIAKELLFDFIFIYDIILLLMFFVYIKIKGVIFKEWEKLYP